MKTKVQMDSISEGAFCCAIGCKRRSRDGGYFPMGNNKLIAVWVRKIRRGGGWEPNKHSYVCGDHFVADDYVHAKGKLVLKKNVVPQLVPLPKKNRDDEKKRQEAVSKRSERCKRRQRVSNIGRARKAKKTGKSPACSALGFGDETCVPSDCLSILEPILYPDDILPTCVINVKTGELEFGQEGPQFSASVSKQQPVLDKPEQPLGCLMDVPIEENIIVDMGEHNNQDVLTNWKKQKEIDGLKKANKELQEKIDESETLKSNLKQIFNAEQFQLLCKVKNDGKKWNVKKWSDLSILEGIKKRFKCGSTGYDEHINEGHPLPSIRTLQERTENFKCNPGVDNGSMEILKRRLQNVESDADRDLILFNDEMSLTQGQQYDSSTGQVIGQSTLPMHEGIGTKGMAWLVGGIRKRVKQPVAYHITPNSVHGSAIRLVNEDLIKRIEAETGGRILAYVTDMSGCNVGLWSHYGIKADREGQVVCETEHPVDSNRTLYIMPDTPHLAKNLKASLANQKEFRLSDELRKKHGLKTEYVKYRHIEDLAESEKFDELLMAPKLQKASLHPNTFQQMRVTNSTYVINESTSAGLTFLAKEKNDPGFETTAWFCKKYDNWLSIMTASSPRKALSLEKPEKYAEAKEVLLEFMDIVRGIHVKGGWKPWQKGILIATQAFLNLSAKLLENPEYKFVMGGRFSTNCVENLFSVVRMKYKVPTVLQWKNCLKSIILSQYARSVPSSSYEQEVCDNFNDSLTMGALNFLGQKQKGKLCGEQSDSLPPGWCLNPTTLSSKVQNSLFHVAGYLIDSITDQQITCDGCFAGVIADQPYNASYTTYTKAREYEEGLLVYVTPDTFKWFARLEQLFQSATPHLSSLKDNRILADVFQKNVNAPSFPKCHNIEMKMLNRFVVFRLKIHCDYFTRVSKQKFIAPAATGSMSAGAKAYVDNPRSGKRQGGVLAGPPKKRGRPRKSAE